MNTGEFDLDPAAVPSSSPEPRFELAPSELPAPPGTRAIVREALFPFVVWPHVPVRVLEPRRLGRMETVVLEAGLALDSFDFAELEDATSVPMQVIASSASKLLERGTLREIAPGDFAVDREEAATILATKDVQEERLRHLTFVYFPRQDVVIADNEATAQLLRVTRRLRAPRQAPFPSHIDRAAGVTSFLEQRIVEQRISGANHPIRALGHWPKPPAWPELSPCYYARGHVRGDIPDAVAELELWGYERRKAAGRQYHGEQVKLGSGVPLVQDWIALTEEFGRGFPGATRGFRALSAQRMERLTPCQWRVGVSHGEASALARERWLTDVLPISICSPTAKVDVRISLEPLSGEGADLFALDAVAQWVEGRNQPCSEDELAELLRRALERFPHTALHTLSRRRIEERLWALRRFIAVYTQRAHEDFAYA